MNLGFNKIFEQNNRGFLKKKCHLCKKRDFENRVAIDYFEELLLCIKLAKKGQFVSSALSIEFWTSKWGLQKSNLPNSRFLC